MVNVIAPIFTNEDGLFLQTIYQPLRLCAEHMRRSCSTPTWSARRTPCPSEAPPGRTGSRTWGHSTCSTSPPPATRSGRDLTLVVVNRHREREVETSIELNDSGFEAGATMYEVTGEEPTATNDFERGTVGVSQRSVQTEGQSSGMASPPVRSPSSTTRSTRRSGRVNGKVLDSPPRPPVVDTSRSPHVRLRPVPLDAVTFADAFWAPRRRINREGRCLPSTGTWRRPAAWTTSAAPRARSTASSRGSIQRLRRVQMARGRSLDARRRIRIPSWSAWSTRHQRDRGRAAAGRLPEHVLHVREGQRALDQLRPARDVLRRAPLPGGRSPLPRHRLERLLDVAMRFADHICDTFGPEREGKRNGPTATRRSRWRWSSCPGPPASGATSKERSSSSTRAATACSAGPTGDANRPTTRTTSRSATRARSSGTPCAPST